MNIAIVDDDKSELFAAKTYICEFISQNYPELFAELNVQTFSNPNEFFSVFKPNFFQIIILDIVMPEINGLQTAQIVRARGDDDANILFLTNNPDFVLNAYRVFAVGYFLKPLSDNQNEFADTFAHIFPKLCSKPPELTLIADGYEISVRFRNILYVDIDYRHRLCVYLADGKKIITANNYSEISQILFTDNRFLECYHRIIVNMDYIKSMESDDFILMDGTSIPISQRKKKAVKVNFIRYFAHK